MRTLAVVVALMAAALAWAEEPPELLAEAQSLYRDGQFEEAAESWQQALEAGWDGPRVHYNLGNALYRSEQMGAAIAHYQAALTLAPRDGDVRTNLDRALTERPAGPPAPSASWLHARAAAVVATFTLSELAGAAAVCWWGTVAAVIGLLIGAGRRRTMRRLAIALGALALVLAGFAIGRWWGYHAVDRAVVAAESAQMRTGPGDSFEVALSVQEEIGRAHV